MCCPGKWSDSSAAVDGHAARFTPTIRKVFERALERAKRAALETFDTLATNWPQKSSNDAVQQKEAADAASLADDCWWRAGGSNSRLPRCERTVGAAVSREAITS
jgi:hypothetical protein